MLILSLDSSAGACSACVWQDGRVLSEASETMERGQDQRLMPLTLSVMKAANVEFNQLDRIVVTRGPGSFTGLRIGLATARGIGLAAGKPVVGIDRFSIFREQAKATQDLLVVIGSKRKELFCQFYPAHGPHAEPTMMTEEEIAAFIKMKPGIIVKGDRQPPLEKEVVTSALLASRVAPNDKGTLPRPLYIRPPDVTISTKSTSQEIVQ